VSFQYYTCCRSGGSVSNYGNCCELLHLVDGVSLTPFTPVTQEWKGCPISPASVWSLVVRPMDRMHGSGVGVLMCRWPMTIDSESQFSGELRRDP
jgi:hypothetical protein